MAPPLPEVTRKAIEHAIQLAQDNNKEPDCQLIATIFFTTSASVYRIRRRMAHVAVHGFHPKRAGPKPAIKSPEQEEEIAKALKEFIEQNVHVNQDGISDWCEERFGVKLSQSSWSRFIKRNDIPHKIGSRFWPKSKLVQTKDRQVKVSKRKKKGDGEAVEADDAGEQSLVEEVQSSQEDDAQPLPEFYDQSITTHRYQPSTYPDSQSSSRHVEQHPACTITHSHGVDQSNSTTANHEIEQSTAHAGYHLPITCLGRQVHPGRAWMSNFTPHS